MSSHATVLAIQNDATDPPLMVGAWLEARGIEVRVIRADLGEAVPETVPRQVHGLLPLGGWMSATQDDVAPWLPAERALIRDAVAREVPVLGLCLGGQLLAEALGGRVDAAEEVEVGVISLRRTSQAMSDPVFSRVPARSDGTVPAGAWHQDRIHALPEGAVLLANSAACEVQAFRVGECAWGLQFHPEIDPPTMRSWGIDGAEGMPDSTLGRSGRDLDEVTAEITAAMPDLVQTWRPMTDAWADLVLARRERSVG